MTTYYAGIDLGTSRVSIATSTGVRLSTGTCVGYPKDIVSSKRFQGRSYLLGQEALKNRLALNLIWPLAHGVLKENDPKALQAVQLILKDIIAQAIPVRKEEDEIFAAIGVPAQASMENKRDMLAVTKDLVNKILIVSEPFAVAYGLDRFDEALVVDMGAGTVDLARIHGSLPEEGDQLTLQTAGNFLDSRITEAIVKEYPNVQLTPQIIRRIKEKHGFVRASEQVVVKLTEKGIPDDYDITEILKRSCLEMTDPICKAVQELVGAFDPEFQEALRNNVIVAGGGSRLKGVDVAIEVGLDRYGGGSAECTQDPEFGGSIGALKMSLEFPERYWAQIK